MTSRSRVVVLGSLVAMAVATGFTLARPRDLAPAAAPPALATVESALIIGDVAGASRAWREAYGGALRARSWRGLVDVGDAAVRIGTVARDLPPYAAHAREAYLAAFIRARAEHAPDGVLRVAAAFDTVGERQAASDCRRLAEQMLAATSNGRGGAAHGVSDGAVGASPLLRLEP